MKAYSARQIYSLFSLFCFSWLMLSIPYTYAQGSIDNATVGADRMVDDAARQQMKDLINQRNSFELQVNKTEQVDENYRVYAEQRVKALMKLKSAGGSPTRSLSKEKEGELYALQSWLDRDAQVRSQEQARIQQLDKAIANLQQTQTSAINDMRSDIHNMRVDADAQAANQKFQQQMAVNYFNELQSEMGAASWGRPPTDGTLNTQSGSLDRMFRGGGGGGFGGYGAGGYNY